ncbi:MAG: zinc-dependent alcohol dehydrogenase family protein [Rhodospirillaceae bacterium]|nr:zinc-dependent alcohol dehydrogenase family protein [Rhodospirillaceae bacterium]
MKVLRQIGHGDADAGLRLDDDPIPAPGPGEVVVALEVAPVQLLEVWNLKGPLRFPAKELPRVPGSEGVGRIVQVGDNVTRFKRGDRVFTPKFTGTFREMMACPAETTYRAPEGVPADQLCIVSTMGLTAILLLEDYVPLPPGAWLMHDAANSSIGRFVVGMAHARGWRTVNIVRRAGLDNEIKALGGDAVVVDPGTPEGLKCAVDAATGGAAITVALDMIGGDLAGRLAHGLAENGTLVLYGATGGEPARVDFIDMGRRGTTLTGMGMSRSFNKRTPEQKDAVWDQLGRWARDGVLKTRIAGAYALSDYKAAYAHAAVPSRERDGKVIFRFD